MPAQTLDSLFRSLQKGQLTAAYYLHGPEDILKDEAVRMILDRALDPALRDFNLDQRYAGQLDAESLVTLCNTVPMMAERRVVVLREVEAWKRKPKVRATMLNYLEDPSPETIVVLVQGAGEEEPDRELVRSSCAVACEPLPTERALKWLQRRATALGVQLEESASSHLLQAVGGDLGALAAELQKIAALPEGEPLTVERIGELVGVRHGETIFDWRDAVFDDRPDHAVRLLSPVLDQPGSTGVKLVTLLGTTLVGIGIARAHYDRGLKGRALDDMVYETIRRNRVYGLLGWSAEKSRWVRWAANWPAVRVRNGLRAARDADQALKGITISDERGVLTDLLLRLAVPSQVTAA
jgi:DNA polymerase III subunit delta